MIKRVIIDSPRQLEAPPRMDEPPLLEYVAKLPAPADALPVPLQDRLKTILNTRVMSKVENPFAVLDEVCTVIDAALAEHYGT